MKTDPAALPFLGNIGLMLTYRCTTACPHCVVEAGPHRREELGLEQSLVLVDAAAAYRNGHIKGLALTGGEPFYNLDHLAQISDHGLHQGFVVSVVTNAFWAESRHSALETLRKVPAIRLISISTDVYHQRAIPFEYVKNATRAARELDRLCSIAICTDNEEDAQYQSILADLEGIGEGDNLRKSITFPVGRARRAARRFNYRTSSRPTVSACPMASSPVVFPGGMVNACIGPVLTLESSHPLNLGNIHQDPLPTILDRAEMNPILHIIRVWGPHRLVALLEEHGLGSLLPRQYLCDCSCDVCYKLFSNARIVEALHQILQNEEMRHTIAYARTYYLNETTMAERYGLARDDSPESQPPVARVRTSLTAPASAMG